MTTLTTPTFLVVWALDATAATLVYLHANKRGSRHASAWGIGVFLFLGIVLPVYVIHARRGKRSGRRY